MTGPRKEPTVDQYTKLKNDLTQLILRKKETEAKLAVLEDQIYEKEADYFDESTYGNIVKGFDSFAKTSLGGKRKMVYTDEDHIFSMLLSSFVKTLLRKQGTTTDLDDYEDSVEPPLTKEPVVTTPRKKK